MVARRITLVLHTISFSPRRRFASDIRRGLSRRFASVNTSRSTNEKNVFYYQNMPRRTILEELEDLRREASAFIGQVTATTRRTARSRTLAERAAARIAALQRTQQRKERRGTTYRIADWADQALGPYPQNFLLTILKRHAGQHIRIVAFSGEPLEDDQGRLSCGPLHYYEHPQGYKYATDTNAANSLVDRTFQATDFDGSDTVKDGQPLLQRRIGDHHYNVPEGANNVINRYFNGQDGHTKKGEE